MKDFKKIIEKLKQVTGASTDKEVASSLDSKVETFSRWKTRNSIPYEHLVKFCNERNVNINWLLLDKGDMFIKECDKQNISGNNNVQLNNASIHISHNQKEIEEIVNILKDLPERSIKKLYHLAELEKLKDE